MLKQLSIDEVKNLRDSYAKEIANLKTQLHALELMHELLCNHVADLESSEC